MRAVTPIRISRPLAAFVVIVLLLAPSALAARGRASRQQYQAKIKHGQTLNITINDLDPAVTDQLLTGDVEDNSFDLHHESKMQVVIVDANPLLYKYEIVDKEEKLLASAEALQKFAKAIGELQGSLEGIAGPRPSGIARMVEKNADIDCVAGQDVDCFAKLAAKVLLALSDVEDVLTNSETDRVAMKATVDTWKVDAWRKLYDELAPKLPRIALDAAGKAASASVAANLTTAPGIEAAARAQAVVSSANLAVGLSDDVDEALKTLATVKRLSQKVGTDMPLDEAFSIDRMHSEQFTVRVSKTDEFPKDLETVRFTGDRKIRVQPYEAAPVRLVPVMVYSRVPNPTLEAKADGDHFVIKETKTEFNGLDLAAALEIAPRSLDFATWNGVIQLGIAPQKDIGIFLGAGMQVRDLFTFGAGLAYQRVNALGSGLTVGQSIATADLLKIDKRYDTGIYFFITTAKK
jgi:hypothetical protein